MQSYKDPNKILKHYKINIINLPMGPSKLTSTSFKKNLQPISQDDTWGYPFLYHYKKGQIWPWEMKRQWLPDSKNSAGGKKLRQECLVCSQMLDNLIKKGQALDKVLRGRPSSQSAQNKLIKQWCILDRWIRKKYEEVNQVGFPHIEWSLTKNNNQNANQHCVVHL